MCLTRHSVCMCQSESCRLPYAPASSVCAIWWLGGADAFQLAWRSCWHASRGRPGRLPVLCLLLYEGSDWCRWNRKFSLCLKGTFIQLQCMQSLTLMHPVTLKERNALCWMIHYVEMKQCAVTEIEHARKIILNNLQFAFILIKDRMQMIILSASLKGIFFFFSNVGHVTDWVSVFHSAQHQHLCSADLRNASWLQTSRFSTARLLHFLLPLFWRLVSCGGRFA